MIHATTWIVDNNFKIAIERCNEILGGSDDNNERSQQHLARVVHVGDAPADVLAAKSYALGQLLDETDDDEQQQPVKCTVGMVGVATGSYSVEQLTNVAGETIPGIWEPIILKEGMKDPMQFINSCLYGK